MGGKCSHPSVNQACPWGVKIVYVLQVSQCGELERSSYIIKNYKGDLLISQDMVLALGQEYSFNKYISTEQLIVIFSVIVTGDSKYTPYLVFVDV